MEEEAFFLQKIPCTQLQDKKGLMLYPIFFICCMAVLSASVSLPLEKIQDERTWLEKNYLPACSGRMLYIGVGSYTVNYPYYTQAPDLFETVDFLEERAKFGSPFKHYVTDILLFHPEYLYDNVSFFGILGYPAEKYAPFTTNESINQVLEKIHTLVKVGGKLLVGANYYDREPYTINFWIKKIEEHYGEKYEIVSTNCSQLSIIWLGKKIKE
jgi:hypothetical protein